MYASELYSQHMAITALKASLTKTTHKSHIKDEQLMMVNGTGNDSSTNKEYNSYIIQHLIIVPLK